METGVYRMAAIQLQTPDCTDFKAQEAQWKKQFEQFCIESGLGFYSDNQK